jgi:hypothetical protein
VNQEVWQREPRADQTMVPSGGHSSSKAGTRAGLPQGKKPAVGDTEGPSGTLHGVERDSTQMAFIFFLFFFFLFFHLRKNCNQTAYGKARLIVSLWPLREEGEKKIKLLDRVLLRSCCFNLFFLYFVNSCFFLKQVQHLINGFCLGKTNTVIPSCPFFLELT